jgi:hypothetical protein
MPLGPLLKLDTGDSAGMENHVLLLVNTTHHDVALVEIESYEAPI